MRFLRSQLLSICAGDWIKHSFITKFNFIKSSAYPDYSLILAGDITGVGTEKVNIDHSHAIVKRLGFAQVRTIPAYRLNEYVATMMI